jgi:hypothetical protein
MVDTAAPTEALAALLRNVADELPVSATGCAIAAQLRETHLSPTPAGAAANSQLLARAGFTHYAENIFDALRRLFPAMPTGLAGLAQIAIQRKAWAWSLQLWDELIAAFPAHTNAYWFAARARVLIDLGRQQEAGAILEGISRDFADQPHSRIGLAHLAMHQRLWTDALERWDEVLARYPLHDSVPFSKTTRAGVLLMLGRHAQSEASLRDVIQADPWMIGAQVALMNVLAAAERCDEAAQVNQVGIFADALIPASWRARMAILLQCRHLDEARTQFERVWQGAGDIDSIGMLFELVPPLYEGWRRTEIWLDLLRRLDGLQTRSALASFQAYSMLRARIKLCLGDRVGYLNEIRRFDRPEHLGEFANSGRAVCAALASPHYPDRTKPKVFGIGLSRTGTTTLAAALQALGMTTLHWTNPLTCELISDRDVHLFDALTDTPVCVAFEKYYHLFPASKFVYTTRPFLSWSRSMVGHWQRTHGISEFGEFQRQIATPSSFRYGSEYCALHQTLFLDHADLGQAYEAHELRVRGFFSDKPKDRFMVFDIFAGHGWPELCEFLGLHVPETPFPFENRSPAETARGQ